MREHLDPLFVTTAPDGAVVVAGEIDMATAPDLQAAILASAQPGATVVVDLDQVSFIDLVGLSALEYASRILTTERSQLALRNPSPAVSRLLSLCGGRFPWATQTTATPGAPTGA